MCVCVWAGWRAVKSCVCGRLWRNVLESLTVTNHSFTWRSRTSQCVRRYKTSHMVCFSFRHFMNDVSFESVDCSESSGRERLSLEQHFILLDFLGDIWGCENLFSIRGERKKHCCFLTWSRCSFNCDLWICDDCLWRKMKDWCEGAVIGGRRVCDWAALQVVLTCAWASHVVSYTLVSNVLGGGGASTSVANVKY